MRLTINDHETIDINIDDVVYEIRKNRTGFEIERFDNDFSEPINVHVTKEGIIKVDTE